MPPQTQTKSAATHDKVSDKLILDACCGGRMFWFDKQHPDTLYVDKEERPQGCIQQQPNFHVKPDLVADFKQLPFPDRKFKLIVWDPPHRKNLTKGGIMYAKYGNLDKLTWKEDLSKGFDELWRILDNHGVLIFKWSETFIPLKEVLPLFKQRPLFGHPTIAMGKTMWMCFFKNEQQRTLGGK